MKKNKALFLLFSFVFMFLLFTFTVVAAEGTTMIYNGEYGYTTVSEDIYDVATGVKHIVNHGTAISSSGKVKLEKRITHLYIGDIKNNDNLKIVTWGLTKGNSGFQRAGLLEIAKNYESTHPGWIIMAGINADQFYTGFGTGLGSNGSDYFFPQPYYPYVSSGDNLFVYSPYASCNNVVGFKNNSDDVQLVYGNRSVQGLYIHVYDDNNNELGSFKATDLNDANELKDGESTVLSTLKLTENKLEDYSKTSSNEFYVIENPELSYVSNSVEWTWKQYNVNAFFGKGKISKVENGSVTLSGIQFAIETKNSELKSLLKVGTYVKCQLEFDEGFEGIEEASGFHTVQILDGKVQNVSNGYNNPNYPRSIFGCDDNGKVYLITTEKSTGPKDGMRAQEINAMMLQYGITNAFQDDGGGSVESICRDSEGILDYSQAAYEGDNRPVLTGLFIAMRVDDITIEKENITPNSCDLVVTDNDKNYDQLYIKLKHTEGEQVIETIHKVSDGKVKLTKLNKDTEYFITMMIYKDGDYKELYIKDSFRTLNDIPYIDKVTIELQSNGSYLMKVKIVDVDEVCLRASVNINGSTHALKIENGEATLTLPSTSTNVFNMEFNIDCKFTAVRKTITIDDFNFESEAHVYLENIKSAIDEFFKFGNK